MIGLPCSPESEKLILGGILADPECFANVAPLIRAEDFMLGQHGRIFRAFEGMHKAGTPIQPVALYNALGANGDVGLGFISDLMGPRITDIEHYCRLVRDKATLRRIAVAAQSLSDECLVSQGDPGELIERGTRILRELDADRHDKASLQTFGEIVREAGGLDAFGSRPEPGIATPFADLNRAIGGFRPGELIVLGARPSAGKSVMAGQIGVHAAMNGHEAIEFSLEMTKRASFIRAACHRGQVDANRLRRGELSPIERHKFITASSELVNLPFWIDDKARTFPDIAAATRRHMAQHPVELVIIDHLHLMRSVGTHDNRNNELDKISADLKLMAKDLDVAMLLLAHLSRASETEKRAPELRDLRDCGQIEGHADLVIFLDRKEEMGVVDKRVPVPVDLLLAKQRDGVSRVKIEMLLMGRFYTFVESTDGREQVA